MTLRVRLPAAGIGWDCGNPEDRIPFTSANGRRRRCRLRRSGAGGRPAHILPRGWSLGKKGEERSKQGEARREKGPIPSSPSPVVPPGDASRCLLLPSSPHPPAGGRAPGRGTPRWQVPQFTIGLSLLIVVILRSSPLMVPTMVIMARAVSFSFFSSDP